MPKFFLFPAAKPSLWRIAAASIAYGFAGWILGRNMFSAPIFGAFVLLLAALGTGVFLARYGFLVIERTAAGYLRQDQYPEFAERGSPSSTEISPKVSPGPRRDVCPSAGTTSAVPSRTR